MGLPVSANEFLLNFLLFSGDQLNIKLIRRLTMRGDPSIDFDIHNTRVLNSGQTFVAVPRWTCNTKTYV